MPRVVGGTAAGRRLEAPPGRGTRPTSDRAREGVFNTIDSLLDLDGARVLDLYAGSGALGIEAISRGAIDVVFVDSDAGAAATIRSNLRAVDGARTRVRRQTATGYVGALSGAVTFDLVLLDPPYNMTGESVHCLLTRLAPHVESGGVVVLERPSRDPSWEWPEPLVAVRHRRYGEATVWYGRRP